MAETGNTPDNKNKLINLGRLETFLDESKKIFEPTLPSGTDGQVLKLSSGKPAWGTDNTPTTFSWTGGTTDGPTGSLTGNGMTAVAFPAMPGASESASGVVTTGNQTFAGTKTFKDTISGSIDGNAATSSRLKTAVSLTTTDGTNTSGAVSFDGSKEISIELPSTIAATFSGDLTGDVTGNAGTLSLANGTADVSRFIIFQASSNDTSKLEACYDTDFKYNPVSNLMNVGSVQLNSKVTLQYNSSTESLDFVFA